MTNQPEWVQKFEYLWVSRENPDLLLPILRKELLIAFIHDTLETERRKWREAQEIQANALGLRQTTIKEKACKNCGGNVMTKWKYGHPDTECMQCGCLDCEFGEETKAAPKRD